MNKFFLIVAFSFLAFPPLSFSTEILNTDNYLDSATLFKEEGEYEKAIEVLVSGCAKSDDDRLKLYLGKIYYLNGNGPAAVLLLEKIKEKNWHVFLYLGLSYESLDRKDDALRNYARSVEMKENSIALYRAARIYYDHREYSKAADFFSRVITQDSSIRLAYYYLGDCFLNMKEYTVAYKNLSKADNFYPSNEKIKEKLSIVKNKLGEDFFAGKKQAVQEERKKAGLTVYRREKDLPEMKIGIAKDLGNFTFKAGRDFLAIGAGSRFNGEGNRFYTFTLKNKKILLSEPKGSFVYARFDGPVTITVNYREEDASPFYILDLVYGEGNFWRKEVDRVYRGAFEILPKEEGLTLVNVISIEEYLYGVLTSEIPASSNPEALKAQALAARTIAFKNQGRHKKEGFDFCADVHCQVYQGVSAETPAAIQAVKDTRGEIIVYDDQPVETFYHANCGGCLSSDAFGARDYLTSKYDLPGGLFKGKDVFSSSLYEQEEWFYELPDAFCRTVKGSFRWQRVYDPDDFFIAFGFKLEDLKNVSVLEKGDCFRYKKMEVVTEQGKEYLDRDLKIRDYFDKLRSSAFKFEIKYSSQKKPAMIFFWGAGFGHGAGLCQEGAMRMAQDGYGYQEIIKHYYPNTKIKKLY